MSLTFAISQITGANGSGAGDYPGVQDTDNFSFLVTYTNMDDITTPETPTPITISSVSATCSFSNINITIVNANSFRVSGTYFGIFNDAYVFRMKDLSIQTLPAFNPSALGIFRWIFPSIRDIISNFNVTVHTFTDSTNTTPITVNETRTQDVTWNFASHMAVFRQIVAQGA
jgi:hypothetical protein